MKKTCVLMACFGFLPSLLHAESGTWRLTSALQVARDSHTATLLLDGRVLVAGGGTGPGPVAVADVEIFDPDTERWSRAASMKQARTQHTACLLKNGRVLVVGGLSQGVTLNTAELYNPVANTWSAVKDLNTARAHHTAEVLPDGRVLVAGGFSSGGAGATSDVEIFDPVTGTWSLSSGMLAAREQHTSNSLPGGRVLVTGGISSVVSGQFAILSSVEVYDPVDKSWAARPPMPNPRSAHTSNLLQDGRVLVLGGDTPSSEIFNPAETAWIFSGEAGYQRTDHSSTLLSDGRVLAAGGFNNQQVSGSCELYDPTTGTWSPQDPMLVPRALHTATLLPSGLILLAGGRTGAAEMPTGTAELFDPARADTGNLLLYPQLALGGGFEVVLFVTNTGNQLWTGLAQLNGGSWPGSRPWSLNGETRTGNSDFILTLGPKETRRYQMRSTSGPFSGWLEIRGVGDSTVPSLATSFFYNFFSGGVLLDSTGVPPGPAALSAWFPIENSSRVKTGMAIRRSPVPITFSLFDAAGNLVGQTQQALDGAAFLDQVFSGVPNGFVGSVRVVSGVGFYITVLRQEFLPGLPLRFQLTSVPATTVQGAP